MKIVENSQTLPPRAEFNHSCTSQCSVPCPYSSMVTSPWIDATEKVTRWTLSKPVLADHLRAIAASDDDGQELMCTVVDMLDPARSELLRANLHATGVQPADADALWTDLGDDAAWVNGIDWDVVIKALLGA